MNKLPGGPVRVLLADDHRHAREAMREIVGFDPAFAVVGEATSGEEAIAMAIGLSPDLVLMDVNMPGMGGFEAVKSIKLARPRIAIVMVTVSDEPSHLFEALRKGAQGYLLKSLDSSAWIDYLRGVALDESPINPELAASILREFAGSRHEPDSRPRSADGGAAQDALTPRERDILREVARGATNREVAAALGVSEHTVKNHLKNILPKLQLDNRVQLARYAYEHGLARRDPPGM